MSKKNRAAQLKSTAVVVATSTPSVEVDMTPRRRPQGDAAQATPVANAPKQSANSIRKIVRQGLLANRSVKEIAEEIRANFPNSMAAAKSAKHIAFYKSLMKKAGELSAKATAVEIVEETVAAE